MTYGELLGFVFCMTGPLPDSPEVGAGVNASFKWDADDDCDLDLQDWAELQNAWADY